MTSDTPKDIICLANSKKLSGRCVAGKDLNNNFEWIRPVGNTSSGELSEDQIKYDNGAIPQVLDIIQIPLGKASPKYYQPENILLGTGNWEKTGDFPTTKLDSLCDHPQIIWNNDQPNAKKISTRYLRQNKPSSSLLLIKPESANIIISHCEEEVKFRAFFKYNKIDYDLPLTDLIIRNKYEDKLPGTYKLPTQALYFCISLGEPFKPSNETEEYCYKLVAAVIMP